jgi:transposase
MAARQAKERLERLEAAIVELVPQWSLGRVAEAMQATRGVDIVSAAIFLAEVGDLSRFDNPQQLMSYLGLVPSERSTGDSIKRGPITRRAICGRDACWSKVRGRQVSTQSEHAQTAQA